MICPLEFTLDNDKPVVKYTSPLRKFSNYREELNIDAVNVYNKYGPCYLAFSSGIDCQVILRSWLDMNLDIFPFFIYSKGCNTDELEAVKYAEKFYGISIPVITVDINEQREEWTRMSKIDNVPSLVHYPFDYASKQLPESFPMLMSGPSEPCPIGLHEYHGVSIYHNIKSTMIMRCEIINKTREVIDFPYSSESLASYYCDDIMKTYADASRFFMFNGLEKDNKPLSPTVRFEYYAKPFIKGRYYKKDIFYPSKKTGHENYPEWMITDWDYPVEYRVSAPYNSVVEHLERCDGSVKEYRDWIYP